MTTSSPPMAAGASRRRGTGVGLALIVLLFAAAAVGAVALLGSRTESIAYATAPLERGLISKRVDANGTVVARDMVQVGTEISGRVTRIAVDFNATVNAGDLLAELATDIYRTRVAESEAELRLAHALLEVARSKVGQFKAEHDAALMRIESADAERAAAAATLGFARNEMQRRSTPGLGLAGSDRDRARADLDGAAAQFRAADAARAYRRGECRRGRRGQRDGARRDSPWPRPPSSSATHRSRARGSTCRVPRFARRCRASSSNAMSRSDRRSSPACSRRCSSPSPATSRRCASSSSSTRRMSDRYAKGSASSSVSPRIRAHLHRRDHPAQARADADPERVTYVAMLSAPNPERLLRPGMTATVRVDVEERADVPRLPNAALRFRPQREEKVEKLPGRRPGGRTGVVHVETGDGLREVAVDLGLVDDRFTEIRGGLAPGASVVTGYR